MSKTDYCTKDDVHTMTVTTTPTNQDDNQPSDNDDQLQQQLEPTNYTGCIVEWCSR